MAQRVKVCQTRLQREFCRHEQSCVLILKVLEIYFGKFVNILLLGIEV